MCATEEENLCHLCHVIHVTEGMIPTYCNRCYPSRVRLGALTWKCHVCGVERADEMIAVATASAEVGDGGKVATNVRYCRDRKVCHDRAVEMADEWLRRDLL